LEAAICGYAKYPDDALCKLINDFILLLQSAQAQDGYLYTYNQLIFPESRWQNLQIEHELYCHGYLIEAAVSHFQVTGESKFLTVAIKAADLLVNTFSGKGSLHTPGHQEIESISSNTNLSSHKPNLWGTLSGLLICRRLLLNIPIYA
jgi:hypothetical protein